MLSNENVKKQVHRFSKKMLMLSSNNNQND